jgi:hypothetical protein
MVKPYIISIVTNLGHSDRTGTTRILAGC